jgi:uncharacterized membrane protein
MLRKLGRIYPPVFELLPLFFLFLSFYVVISNYNALPETIPTHFNFRGMPDGWGGKGGIWIFPGMGIGLYILITGVSLALAAVGDPKKMINLPSDIKARIGEAQAEELRTFLVRALLAIKIVVLGMEAYLVNASINVALGQADGIGMWPFLFVAVILLVVGYMVVRSLRLALSTK